jgi:hypothetical protein
MPREVENKVINVGTNILTNSLRTCACVMHARVAEIWFMELFRW